MENKKSEGNENEEHIASMVQGAAEWVCLIKLAGTPPV
jgi:hypothetical protein